MQVTVMYIFPQVCKNVVVAGLAVVIQDDRTVTEDDLASNFFLRPEDIGQNVRDTFNVWARVTVMEESSPGHSLCSCRCAACGGRTAACPGFESPRGSPCAHRAPSRF